MRRTKSFTEPVPTRFYCPRELYEAWEFGGDGFYLIAIASLLNDEYSRSFSIYFHALIQRHQGRFPGEWLGDLIFTPGWNPIKVLSGPCCRLYWGNGYAEADKIECAWEPKDQEAFNKDPIGYSRDRRNWSRNFPNYLSYMTPNRYAQDGMEVTTVRWQRPTHDQLEERICQLVCPLGEPLKQVESREKAA